MSFPFLVARRLGFPYPRSADLLAGGLANYELAQGCERIIVPIIPTPFRFQGVSILQPIFGAFTDPVVRGAFYTSQFVQANTMDCSAGIGKVFIEKKHHKAMNYPDEKSLMWLANRAYRRQEMNPNISIVTLELQEYVDTLTPSRDKLPVSERQWWAQMLRSNKTFNRKTIATLRLNARREGLSIT
jgi:hypothetical protein